MAQDGASAASLAGLWDVLAAPLLWLARLLERPEFFFYLFGTITVVSALVVITRKNPIYAAIALVASLLGVAGLFLSLQAEFMAMVQILVYTGGVMVLFLFAIMLVNVEDLPRLRARVRGWWLGAAVGGFTFAALAYMAWRESAPMAAELERNPEGNVAAVAKELFVKFLLPFEIVSILLLVAMIGAIILNKREA